MKAVKRVKSWYQATPAVKRVKYVLRIGVITKIGAARTPGEVGHLIATDGWVLKW
jgi:hypothetical protein